MLVEWVGGLNQSGTTFNESFDKVIYTKFNRSHEIVTICYLGDQSKLKKFDLYK